MTTPLVQQLAQARAAGFTLTPNPDGTLTIRGTRAQAELVRALLARKAEVLTLVDLYNGRVQILDWRQATVSEQPTRCILCRRPALVRDPYDRSPVHKTCVERTLSPSTSTERSVA